MFQFSWFRLPRINVRDTLLLNKVDSSIRKSPGHGLFAAHRSISLLTTSFIAYLYQVIHHKLFVA